MRTTVFFNLPAISLDNEKRYRAFRKFSLSEGFMMLQESVYYRLSLNQASASTLKNRIEKNRPSMEIVQILTIAEEQFQSMEYIVGESRSSMLGTDEGLIVL